MNMYNREVVYVDLIKLSGMLNWGTIPNVSFVVHLEEQATYPYALDYIPFPTRGYSVYRAKLYCGKFDRAKLEQKVIDKGYIELIRRMSVLHFLLGEIYILADDELVEFGRQNYLIEVSGNLHRMKDMKCRFILAKWKKYANEPFKAIGCSYSDISNKYKPIKDWIDDTLEWQEFSRTEPPHQLQVTGKEIVNPIIPAKPKSRVYSADELDIISGFIKSI